MIAEDASKLDGLNDCIIGTDPEGYLVYSYAKLCRHYYKDGMSFEEAVEFVDYNILGLGGEKVNWTIVFPLIDELEE